MGSAIIRGVADGLLPPEQIWITDIYKPLVDELCEEMGVNRAADVSQLVENVDCILYAAKPNNVPEIFPEISASIKPHQWLISIAAGVPAVKLESYFSPPAPIVRVMPNITISVGAAVSVIAGAALPQTAILRKHRLFLIP